MNSVYCILIRQYTISFLIPNDNYILDMHVYIDTE